MNSYRRNAGDGLSSLFSDLLRGRWFQSRCSLGYDDHRRIAGV